MLGTGLALALFAAARSPEVALLASFIAGLSWILIMTTMFVSAQVALPDWVRGRGLAIFLTAYFGAMTLGSALWGEVADEKGLAFALFAAAAGAGEPWPDLALEAGDRRGARSLALDALAGARLRRAAAMTKGPILVIDEYSVDPEESANFSL